MRCEKIDAGRKYLYKSHGVECRLRSERCIGELIKKAFNVKIQMQSALDAAFVRLLDFYEKAKIAVNRSFFLSLTSTLCVPESEVTTRDGSFRNNLNSFLITV